MTNNPPIEVTVVGGYLGAGKTTVVNHILRNADERLAVLVNDFGDINIDADLIESEDGDTISLANGCICCSMVDGFIGALEQIRTAQPRPQRLVIEASGVANPAQITPYAYGPGLRLDGSIVVVDAEQIRSQLRNEYIGDVITQQLGSADLLVLNKADLVDDLHPALDAIAAHTAARCVPATNGDIPLDVLLGLEVVDHPAASTSVAADDRFRTWSETHVEPLERSELERRLGELPDSVVRAKGLVRFTDAPNETAIVQMVGSRLSITTGDPWGGGPSRLVFIAVDES